MCARARLGVLGLHPAARITTSTHAHVRHGLLGLLYKELTGYYDPKTDL
jgi:hypothetical protein